MPLVDAESGDGKQQRSPPELPPAMLLDLDDTILDDSGAEDTWRTVCTEAAAAFGGIDTAVLCAAVDRKRVWFWSDPVRHRIGRLDLRSARRGFVEQALDELRLQAPGRADLIAERYHALRDAGLQPLPGAIATLQRLCAHGVRLALLTNGAGPAQRAKIDRFDLGRFFDTILIEGENPYGKPDERVYHLALRTLSATPADAWIVGDNPEWEVAVPQRLGLFAVWVDRTGAGLPPHSPIRPDRTVRSIAELVQRWSVSQVVAAEVDHVTRASVASRCNPDKDRY